MPLMRTAINERQFLDESFRGIVEIGRELLSCVYGSDQDEVLGGICNRLRRINENAEQLNFGKMEEVTGLLESILCHVGTKKILVDEKLIRLCLQANNLCCDILKSIKESGREQSEKYSDVIKTMMKYLDFNMIKEYPIRENESINNSITRISNPDKYEESDKSNISTKSKTKFLDTMLDAVGDLFVSSNEWEFKKAGKDIQVIASRLHKEILSMKMTSVEEMLQEIYSEMKKTTSKNNKHVRLEMIGGGSMGIDRELAIPIKQSLSALVNYAVGHDQNYIGVKAYNKRGRIVLEIRNDGSGEKLNFNKVKSIVEGKGGRVDVEDTVYCISFPMVSETLSVLMMKISDVYFCISYERVIALEMMDEKSVVNIRNTDFYCTKGERLPLVRMGAFFDLKTVSRDESKIVIVDGEKNRFAIEIDSIVGTQDVVVKNIDMGFSGQDIYMGVTLSREEDSSFVVDVDRLYDANFGQGGIKIASKTLKEEASKDEREMIVFKDEDDKIYGVPVILIEKMEKVVAENIHWSGEQAIVRYAGKALPVINLKRNDAVQSKNYCCVIFDMDGVKKGFFYQ